MEKKKVDFELLAKGVGKSAQSMLGKAKGKAVSIIDQNNDGKIDTKDVSIIANSIGDYVKETSNNAKEFADEKRKQIQKATLMPVFASDIDSADFSLTKLIRICEPDKKRLESDVCQGAIGHFTEAKDFKYINIYANETEKFGISFIPDKSSELYYVDPSDRDCYIALDEYFSRLRVERVSELQKIAQDLGAKYFKITFKEEKVSFTNENKSAQMKVKGIGNAASDSETTSNKFDSVNIEAEMEFPGHKPERPVLKYLKRDPSIENLIKLRMDEKSPVQKHKLSIKLSHSSGMKESDAVKIDAVIKGLKCAGNTTVVSEAKNEARRYFEYEIEF